MDILIVSNQDNCRSRIAQEVLYSFGRGFKITTAGISEGNSVSDVLCHVMQQKGYDVTRKKPTSISVYTNIKWDLIITLNKDATEEVKILGLHAEHQGDFNFQDPFEDRSLDEDEYEKRVEILYQDMYKELYEFYRDVLAELVLPRCTCGANTYCRCE